jgi:coenzyme F420-reducing hydrogenase beta subunit
MCFDMTAEFADIAVGAAEGIDGWNTLIVGQRGAELAAAERRILEVDSLPDEPRPLEGRRWESGSGRSPILSRRAAVTTT